MINILQRFLVHHTYYGCAYATVLHLASVAICLYGIYCG